MSEKLFAKQLTARKNLKMLKLPVTIVFLALKGYFFKILIYGLLLVHRHGQIYPGLQNTKEITRLVSKVTFKGTVMKIM